MADLTITAASVVPGSDARIDRNGFAGEAVTAGQTGYKAADGLWYKVDSNSATALARVATGIFVNSASLGQPVAVQTYGDITIGATLTANTTYYLSDTPGGICPLADVGTGEYLEIIGVAKSTTVMTLVLKSTGVAN